MMRAPPPLLFSIYFTATSWCGAFHRADVFNNLFLSEFPQLMNETEEGNRTCSDSTPVSTRSALLRGTTEEQWGCPQVVIIEPPLSSLFPS